MIRYINCFRKHPDLSDADFRDYWQSAEFDELIKKVGDLTRARRHSKNLTLQVDIGESLLEERGLAHPYDGTVEYYWDNAAHLQDIHASQEAQALIEQVRRFQSQFIDLAGSTAFFTELEE